ncbi:leucine rich repeat domain containing protein [Acanthamoeba castellanii str. Neff]|uniref:Leucine rich repeat domain containing protein n=1 Tax=Acanthamoeba castellanii (strain ATCC 30010 / Neff) TaxID=1257118 RepID=L8HH95_ACACF|nr:leucine rich repeat domain containing protein [Acanthamoeba castellanii str. Neff]ELR24954.1 leucine rich repeat domain containing protein [Acanthamoeba castellanii str. Neff]
MKQRVTRGGGLPDGLRPEQRSTLLAFQQQIDVVNEAVVGLAGLVEESELKQGSCAFVAAYLRPSVLQLQHSLDALQRKNLRKADKGAAWALRPNEGFFGRLPDSVIGHILSYLQPKSLVAILRSSKYFHDRWRALLPKKGSSGSEVLPDTKAESPLGQWLSGLGLPVEYSSLLISDGFEDIDTLLLVTDQDLFNAGIRKSGHRRRMLYTLRGIRRGFWTAFPANQLVLPLPADVITSNALAHTTEDETDDTVGDDDDRRSLTDKNVEDEEDLSEAVATDTEKDSGTKGKPKVAESPDTKDKKKKGSKKEKTSKKSSSPSRGVTFEGSQQASSDKAKEAKEKTDSKASAKQAKQTNPKPPKIDPLPDKIVSVDYSRRQLTSVPPQVWQSTDATILNMYMNKLESIPPDIGHLKGLTALGLNENNLKKLPPEIGNLTRLRILDLRYNKLRTVPANIKHLTQLSKLFLRFNRLVELPEEIGSLQSLEILSVRNNQLTSLPRSLDLATNLKVLDVSTNKLQFLNCNLSPLIFLKELDCKQNMLSVLPTGWSTLSNLTRVDLSHNQFAQFPPALAELPSLAELDMEGNQLTSLVDIGQLTALERLYLNSNRLVTLPPSMGKLRSLKYLQLRANQLTSLPEGTSCVMAGLELREADLSSNNFSEMPEAILVSTLQNLSITDNVMTKLPPTITRLQSLKTCNLEGNQLESLDPGVALLTNLVHLRLGYNEISTIPDEVSRMSSLQELDLEHNRLESLPQTIGGMLALSLLVLNDNLLDDLPNELVLLDKLTELKVDGNPMKNIPDADQGGNAVFHFLLKRYKAAKKAGKKTTAK